LSSSKLHQLVLGTGVAAQHCHLVETHPKRVDDLAQLIRREIEYKGLSVIICVRECLEKAKRRKKEAARQGGQS
jgi:indolepyruvate ferredoxin oxidoreductase alpha subunit